MQIETVQLPAHWACALINGDTSGMSDADERAFNEWIKANPHLGACLSCSETSELARFDGLLTDCLTFDFPL